MATRDRALRVGVPMLLATSGLLLVAAARERWGAVCLPWGDYETHACLMRQDHRYDFLLPADPWDRVGEDATLAGVALLLLGVAAAGIPVLLLGAGRARMPAWARAGGWAGTALLSATFLGAGWVTLQAGLTGDAPAESPEYGIGWLLAWPAALVALALVGEALGLPGGRWRWLAVVLLVLSTPLATFLLVEPLAMGYMSYDTAPWTEAWSGVLMVLAAPALWRAGVVAAKPVAVPEQDRDQLVASRPTG